jgi:nucleotide-binding universal stress UspA family protein
MNAKDTTMYTKVVVPLDGSPLAEVALPYAEEIAAKMSSDMVFLTVLPSEDAEEYKNHLSYSKKIVETTKLQVGKYSDNSNGHSFKISTATRNGNPAEGILDFAEKGYPCLIVMATHGRSGISRWSVGSVADKVVRATSRQPLLLIRAKGSHPDVRAKRILKKALVPLDGSGISEAVLPFICEIARSLQMEITLLQVIPKTNHTFKNAETYLRDWCRRLGEDGISAGYQVKIGAAADQIIDFANETATDLVAMSTRGQTALNLWSLGSVAQKVLLGGDSPLLLIKG